MKMRKEQILVYLPGKNTREYSFTSIGVAVYTFLAILLIVGLMAASAYVGLRFITPYYYSGHKMVKNKTVLKNVEEIRENLVYAEAYLDSMVELNNEIRLTAGLPNHSINSKDLAIGGYDVLKDPDDAENDIERLDANVRILSSKISYELENYKALYLDVRNYRKKLDYIPAISPLAAEKFYISSSYGYRTDPFTKKQKWHSGLDMAANRGTDVIAVGKGKVISSYYSRGGYGNVIKIDHGYGYVTVYAHLNRRLVSKGDKVERGDHIGDVGSTGRSTGPHLHYEIQKDGKTVNPLKYLWTDEEL